MNKKNILAAVWLIGLGILFMFNYIWPGILILIGISMIVSATMKDEPRIIPPPFVPPTPPAPDKVVEGMAIAVEEDIEEPLPEVLAPEADKLYLESRLPEKCPACDAPMKANAAKMEWHDDQSVECMFCGYRLEL